MDELADASLRSGNDGVILKLLLLAARGPDSVEMVVVFGAGSSVLAGAVVLFPSVSLSWCPPAWPPRDCNCAYRRCP